MNSVYKLIDNIDRLIIQPLIGLLFALALILFFWGVAQFILNSGGNEEGRTKGKQHMIWGILGMFIMISAYAIIGVLRSTFGF